MTFSSALHRLPGAHTCPFTVSAVPCPDHGYPCPGSPGRMGEGRERYELDVLPWQGPRFGLEELQKPGEGPRRRAHSTRVGEHPRDLPEVPKVSGGARIVACQENLTFGPGTGSNCSLLVSGDSPHAGTPAGRLPDGGRHRQLPGITRAELRDNVSSEQKTLHSGRRWRGPGEWWHI